MPEPLDPVDVFVRKIDAAIECDLAVDHEDLAVISVVVVGRHDGDDRRKSFCPDPLFFEQFPVIRRQRGDLAHAVVHHPHIDAGFGLLHQDLQDLTPHVPFFYDEVLHVDILFRLAQFFQHRSELVFP